VSLVEQNPVGLAEQGLCLALAPDPKVNLRSVGQNKEQVRRRIEIFQEYGLAKLPDEGFAPGAEIVVSVVGREEEEIQVGEGIRGAPGVGAYETSGDYALIGPARTYKAVHDDLVVRRQLHFLGSHGVVPPMCAMKPHDYSPGERGILALVGTPDRDRLDSLTSGPITTAQSWNQGLHVPS
jgi:hypothetical protein